MTRFGQNRDFLFAANFVPVDVAAHSFDFKWNGPEAHLAPARKTPLSKALLGKTNCALFVLTAGTLVWAARRMDRIADVLPALCMSEALLCYQDDANYVRRDRPNHLESAMTKQREIIETLCYETTAIFQATPGEHSSRPPIQAAENVISVTRHILGLDWEGPFRDWVKSTLSRLDQIAANPSQTFLSAYDFESDDDFAKYIIRNVGPPLPISVCDTGVSPEPASLRRQYDEFLGGVDWTSNPYLAPPEMMRALGSCIAYGGV